MTLTSLPPNSPALKQHTAGCISIPRLLLLQARAVYTTARN